MEESLSICLYGENSEYKIYIPYIYQYIYIQYIYVPVYIQYIYHRIQMGYMSVFTTVLVLLALSFSSNLVMVTFLPSLDRDD